MKTFLAAFGIAELNSMQKAAVSAVSEHNEVMLIAPTGSGKTLAFLLPLVPLLNTQKTTTQLLIVVPSRELALQIEEVFRKMSTGFKITCCYGGHSVRIEEQSLSQVPSVVVGTPGRLSHHLRKGFLQLKTLDFLVLDEFDKSLELGFQEEMEYIIKQCKHLHKKVLTSATAMKEIPAFAGVVNPHTITTTSDQPDVSSKLQLKCVKVPGDDKLEALMLLLTKIGEAPAIIFCNHREAVNRISEQLKIYKVAHGIYHGALEQPDREKALIQFRNGSNRILIATDLAARGLDIPEVEFVIHYQLPVTEDIMIHRNGRTARMNANGTAIFLLDKEDHLPPFLETEPEEEKLPGKFIAPDATEWRTLYIGAGKKDKINKVDIVGLLLQKGGLSKDELGKIDILDHSAYAAIKAVKVKKLLELLSNEKIKSRKVKFELAY
ncbi:MAG: DEAD/DEAH box helicase [Bacteroidetes bacterium]|nr:DEAD/DEAH box helicase [Bacteroidota bacterium]MBK9424056.1 DEAD/DEAH box helicase [Bacteroidota bacterium]MBL0073156.1 DEAD/DEAH box helicase [Bacteroidota bacterium]